MKQKKNDLLLLISKAYVSFFGIGFSPIAPGTMGSLATIPIIALFDWRMESFQMHIIIFTTLFVLSSLITHYVQKSLQIFDPGWIVIDEVLGMYITAIIYKPWNWKMFLALFIVFRIFDIVKVWPANYFDEKIKNGFGTNVDDIISGIYSGFILVISQGIIPDLFN